MNRVRGGDEIFGALFFIKKHHYSLANIKYLICCPKFLEYVLLP